MDGLYAMAEAIESFRARGETVAMATLVRVLGSGFRAPGSRMLIGPDGTRVGDLSGGCLDGDVAERAQALLASGGAAQLLVYDGDQIADLAGGFGVGCPRRIEVLLQRVTPDAGFPAAELLELNRRRQPAWLAVACDVEGPAPIGIGRHLLLREDSPGAAPFTLDALLRSQREARPAELPCIASDETRVRFLVERLVPRLRLAVLGGTTIVEPLVRFARELGWEASLFQIREDRTPPSDGLSIHHIAADRLGEFLTLDASTFVVIMEHHQERDLAWLRQALDSPVPYIGLLGSRKRVQKVLDALETERSLTDADRVRLHAPIGFDLGAKSPAVIALAIAAEIQAVATGASGAPKRDVAPSAADAVPS